MEIFLTILSGICWIFVYEECIRLGFKQKTCTMPLFALGLNLSWEFLCTFYDFVFLAHGPLVGMNLLQVVVNGIWVFLDIVILCTYIQFWKKEWIVTFNGKLFYPWLGIVLICCFALQIAFIYEFGFILAAQYSAFLQNLLMSVLFIALLVRRKSIKGQSLLLAVSKWIGTLAPTILFGILSQNYIVLICGIFCTVFDLIYIYILILVKNKQHNKIFNMQY